MALSNAEKERIKKLKEQSGSLRNTSNSSTSSNSSNGRTSKDTSVGSTLSDAEKKRIAEIKNSGKYRYSSYVVDDDYIGKFISDANSFADKYGSAYDSLDYKTATGDSFSSYYDTLRNTESDLKQRASLIQDYLSYNSSKYDEQSYKDFSNYLKSFTSSNIAQGVNEKSKIYSQFETEEDYQTALRYYDYDQKYAGYTAEEIQKALDTLGVGEERDWLRLKQGDVFGNTIRGNTDFQNYADMGSSLSYDDFGTTTRHRGKSRRQRSTTTIDKYRAASLALAEHYGNEAPLGTYGQYDEQVAVFRTMDDNEFENLAYCIAYDKEHGTNMAEQYVDFMEETLSERRGTDIGEKVTSIDIPVIEDLAVLGYGALAGVNNFAFGVEQFMSDEELAHYPSTYANAYISDSLDGIGYYAHSAATNIGNMAPSILASSVLSGLGVPGKVAEGVGSATMGVSAAGSAYKDALSLGYDKKTARTYSNLVGASEGALQYMLGGVSKLGGMSGKVAGKIAAIDKALLRGTARLGVSLVSEITEEEIQNFLEPAFRTIIFGEDYDAPTIDEIIETAIVTMLSTGALEAGGTISETRAESKLNKQAIDQYGESVKELIEEGLLSDKKSESYKLALKYQEQMQGKDGKDGKDLTGYQIRNLVAANEAQFAVEDFDSTVATAKERLTELGETKDVDKLAKLVAKRAFGQELTRAEKSTLANSQYGSKVAKDMLDAKQAAEQESKLTYKSLTSRVGEESRYNVSESGETVNRTTGEVIDLDNFEVTTLQDGMLYVKPNGGEEVYAGDIDFPNESMAFAFSAVADIENMTPAGATALIKAIDFEKPVAEQLNGMDEAYTFGNRGYSEADLKAGEFTKNLTNEQMMSAYRMGQSARKIGVTAKQDNVLKMRTAVDAAIANNATADATTDQISETAPKAKAMTITYNHGSGVVEGIDTADSKLNLSKKQKKGLAVAKVLHKLGLGTDFELFSSHLSETMTDEKGKPVRAFINDEGVEEVAYSGVYMAENGKIRIDLNAYNGRGLTLNALSHELTHFIKMWSIEKYNVMVDTLINAYAKTDMTMHQRVLREQARLERIRKTKVSYDEAFDEVVANAMNKVMDDGKVVEWLTDVKAKDKKLANKLWEGFKKILAKFTDIEEEEPALFRDTEALVEMKDTFEQMKQLWAEALVEASDNYQANLMATEVGVEPVAVEDITQYSYSSLAEAAGFMAVENADGTRSFTRDGAKVSEVTVEDIENSPIGAFINFSVEMKDISDADAKRQKEMFAKICTMACKTNDFAMTMQFVGSAVFTGMKANADKQYGTTYDFPSICTKTQAVIDAMSAKMVSLGRGLTTDEIVQLYDDVFASGNPVPCPECYVFSRWIGIGGLLDNIKKYQDYYGDMDVKDVAAEYLKMKAEVSKFAEEQGISFGKAKGALTSKLTKEFNKLTEKIEKAQNQGEKVKPADRIRLAELEPMMNTVKGMTWLENVYFADSSLKKVNPKFRVPDSVLFDLNNGEAFASQYKDAWAFRTTQGAGYGKAITPYAEARLGEGVLVTNNTTNAIKGRAQGTLNNYFLNQKGKLDKQSRDALKRARMKQKIQAFIGGQRFQSTSDARYENASDYLLAALEMQAMGGMVQVYTKVDGAVPAFSAWGFSINQSLMPLNGGLDADGNVKDTGVGGMNPNVAFENRNKHETAGTITIGVNDNHIRAMFKQWVRDFIIPYHASGGKADTIAEFRRIQEGKEAKGEAVRSTDYSRTQSDKVLSDDVLRWQGKTDAQIQRIHEIRNARIAILTGGKPNMNVVRSNRFLSALYDKLNGGEWDGVKLAKSKVESQIYPNEFWDQTVSYEDSVKITKDYLEYCDDLGFLHRFSGMIPSNGKLVPANGYDQNGKRVQLTDLAYKYDENGNKTAEVEEFFWKVLTDRRMYDNNGRYLAQKVVTLNDTTAETVTDFAKHNQGRQYDKAKSEALAKKIVGNQYSSQDTDLDSDGNELSKSQQQYFSDSKVRDAEGHLMVMYHGTANGGSFTVFEGDQLGNSARTSQVGQGFYFTNAKEEAKSYTVNVDIYGRMSKGKNPHLHEVYLNITNPFDVDNDTLNLDDVKAVYGDGTDDYFFESWIPFYMNRKSFNGVVYSKADVQAMSKSEKVSLYVNYLAQLGTKELLSNMVRAFPSGKQSELLTAMKNRLGYDGIVEEYAPGKYQYVAFSSEQIKSVDNKKPTADKDIRYSSQETDLDTTGEVNYDKEKVNSQEDMTNETRKESGEAFDRRTSQELFRVSQKGQLRYAYRPYLGTAISERAKGAEKELKKLGIPVFIYEKLETNYEGITEYHEEDESATIPGVGVFIPFDAVLDSNEIVGHEGFHFLAESEHRTNYVSVLIDNIDFPSAGFISYYDNIHKKYFKNTVAADSKESDDSREKRMSKLLWEEIFAYITGDIHAGDPKGEVHQFLRDYDAVKVAWDDFLKKQTVGKSELYSSQETDLDIGYHAGDLGKSEGHHMQGGGRSTGHFGTGTYFVSNPKSIEGYNRRNGKPAPIEKVNLSDYNLYRIYSDEVGLKLHRNLQVLDGGVTQEFLDAAKRGDYRVSNLRSKANELADSYDNEVWNEDLGDFFSEDYFGAHIRAYTETLQENGVEFQTFEEWYYEYSGETATAEIYEEYQIDYYDYLKDTLEEADKDRNADYPGFRDAYTDLWLRFGKKQTDAALQNVVDHIKKLRPDGEYNYDLEYGQDSNATVFMKSLGYEGINVSGTGLDNTTYGSVIYDLKGKDLARKKEIGTARYSTQETDNISDRDMLANAFETISRSSAEYEMIQDYKSSVKLLNKLERELDGVNREIRDIRFGTAKFDQQRLEVLESKAKQLTKDITKYDKQLLNMEASAPLRKVIQNERKKEAQKTKDHVKQIQQNKKVRAEQAELRHKIRKVIRDLDKVLNRGNKKLNVKQDIQSVVTKALQAADILFTENYGNYDMLRNGIGADLSDAEEALVNTCTRMLNDLDKMPTDGYDNWQARQEAENRLKAKMSKLKDVFARERKRLNNTTVSSILSELADAYASLDNSEQSYVQGAYSEPVHNFLKSLQSEVGGTIVSDMTKDQLESVYAAYKMVLTTVRKANQMFNEELKQSREQLGNAVIQEVMTASGTHGLWTKGEISRNQASWNNMKPVWVANRIGSDTFGKLMNGLFKGQYNFAVDIDEAKQFKLSMDKKYHPRNWDAEKLYHFESSTGKKFSLNLQQIMSLYAFSKREQAYSHLLNGGFVFENNSTVVVDKKLGIKRTYIHKGASSYKVNEATLNGIVNSLTAEQKAYVDEMQKYLSEVMGEKGNEVSMQLYGIKMFNEEFYFPLRSSGAYMERAKEAEMKKEQGQINLVNSGFTHSVKPQAKNPIILSGFMDVWAEHCNEMSMYHSMVLPMEDFRKVYNYSTVHDENMESASVFQTIQDAYGDAATSYIDQLYRELNAGATVDPRETQWKARISKFKKAAVMLSGSVVVQQFSAIGRAYAVIDPKYFIGAKVKSDTKLSAADEMKKYAPVAIIKEMGGFDTGTKGSAKSYIMAEQYGRGERLKGLRTDEQYRGDIMGYAPAKADEITWCAIWQACKRETKAKNPKMDVKSEEFLKLAGEKFSEVIEKTQVYDSVLARSANMRSKGALMSMATAFMAEPTTTVNLLEDAIRSGKAKNIARAFGAVAASLVLNNALASIVYAMRDDDEDETFIEKYLQSFASGMIDDINPMTYYPFLKDVYSLFQGYDVERADMSVIADVRDALKKAITVIGKDTSEMDDDELVAHYKEVNSVFMSLLDAGCSMFGVPLKNVRRDVNGIINAYKTIKTDLTERDTSWNTIWEKVGSAVKDTIPIYAWTKDKPKADKLYDAIMSDDQVYIGRIKSTYKTDSAYESAVRKTLRENDPRIREAAKAMASGNTTAYNSIVKEIVGEKRFDSKNVEMAISSEVADMKEELKDNDARITEAAIAWNANNLAEYMRIAKQIIAEKQFSQDNVVTAIRSKAESLLPDDGTSSSGKEDSMFTAEKFAVAIVQGDQATARAAKDDIILTAQKNGKTKEEAEKNFISSSKTQLKEQFLKGTLTESKAINALTSYCDEDQMDAEKRVGEWAFEREYGFSYEDRGDAYKSGAISASELQDILVNVGGKTEEEAEWQVKVYDWQNEGFDIDSNQKTVVEDYETYCEPAGIDKNTYFNAYLFYADAGEEGVKYSKTKECMPYINSLPLTSAQKTRLAMCWWAESTVRKYKTW